jgi:hypothetical protein
MGRLAAWLKGNADGFFALVIAVTVGILGVLDVLGADEVNAAILLTLALLSTTLLRDRKFASRALLETSAVRLLSGPEVDRVHADAHHETDQWLHKGGTGTHLRAVTMKECVEHARRSRRPIRMQVEIVDPDNASLCAEYAQYRASLASGKERAGEAWTADRVRKESLATVLAACWYRQRYSFLRIEVGLSSVMTTFRWDMCSQWVMISQEPTASAMLFEKGRPHFRAFNRELVASFEQTRQVDVTRAKELTLSDEPSVDQTRELFALLGLTLPGSFVDRDVADIVRRALKPGNPGR